MKEIKDRFCPSPTGRMHLGNARTAIFNALLAHDGVFLLRIEDTDSSRSKQEFTEGLMEDLNWLGIPWDEGPGKDKGNGPYWQSQRKEIYDNYYQKLEQANLAYPCFCTEEQLALSRKIQRGQGKPPRYAGTCANLSKEEVENKIAAGLQATLRFRVPGKQAVQFHDVVKGRQKFNTDDLGDFIIRRVDGTATFMYCNAIDDAMMGVTHVVRGEDHLTNSPRQILLLQALNLPEPTYCHISLITGPDGSPLSKRHGSRSIKDLREMGYLPEAILNYLARLGHYYESNEFMSISELANLFKAENLNNSPARYDPKQLDYWQKEAVHNLKLTSLIQWAENYYTLDLNDQEKETFLDTIKDNILFPSDIKTWFDSLYGEALVFNTEQLALIKSSGDEFMQALLAACENSNDELCFNTVRDTVKNQTGVKGKALFQPLRLIFTGQLHGPDMSAILKLLGKDRATKRVHQAIRFMQN